MSKRIISPSILSADFANLQKEINLVSEAGAEFIHVDVMDGHFVPNLTIGMPVVKSLRNITQKTLDVHLMIERPEKYIAEFVKAGSDYLTLHQEATEQMEQNLDLIKSLGAKAGITLRPKTDVNLLVPYLKKADLVLVMSVEPGFGGQKFMSEQLEKVQFLKQYREQNKLDYLIEIDGGVTADNVQQCWDAGVDVVVAGTAVFSGEKSLTNYKNNIERLLCNT